MPNHPDEPVTVELSAEHQDVLAQMARSYAGDAPDGWVRIVIRHECSVDPEIAGAVAVREVVYRTPEGLAQDNLHISRGLHFVTGGMLRELAGQSPTRTVVLHLVVDRDGTHTARIEQDVPRVLVGVRDETSSKPVHEYLERHRTELEDLAARLG